MDQTARFQENLHRLEDVGMDAIPGELVEDDTDVVAWLDSPEGLAWTAQRFAPVKWAEEAIASLRPLSQLGDRRHQYTPCPDSGDGMVRCRDWVVGMFWCLKGLPPPAAPHNAGD